MKFKRIASFGSALLLSLSSLMVLSAPHVFAAAITWNGTAGDGKLATAGNWVGGVAPVNGDSIVFPKNTGTIDVAITNDLGVGVCINGITTNANDTGKYSGYTISGATLHVQGTYTEGASDILTLINSTLCGNLTLADNSNISLGSSVSHGTFDMGAFNVIMSDATNFVFLESLAVITGTGTITGGSQSFFYSVIGSPSYSGNISVGYVVTKVSDGLGTGTVTTPNFQVCSDSAPVTIANNISVGGSLEFGCGFRSANGLSAATFTGTITLTSNTQAGIVTDPITLTVSGPLHGSFTLLPAAGNLGTLVINSSDNTSLTPNGNASAPVQTITVNAGDSQPSTFVNILNKQTYVIDGTRGDTIIESGGILKGTGTVGSLTAFEGGIVAPGHSPGCLNSGNLSLSGTYQAEIGGTTACTSYDQLNVTGTVTVSGATLSTSLYNSYKPKDGESYIIISNDGSDAVTGTFKGLAEGATFTVNGYVFKITYKGGDGNDVVLTVQSVPAAPNTGFAILATNPAATLTVTTVLAAGVYMLSRKHKFATSKKKK
jgi:hypothetical protein